MPGPTATREHRSHAARLRSHAWLDRIQFGGRGEACLDFGLLALGLLIYTARSGSFFLDGRVRFRAVEELVTNGTLSDMDYSLWGPLFSVPLWPLGHVFKSPEWWLSRYNVLLFVLGLAALWLLLKDLVEHGLLRKFFLILLAASMFSAHLHNFYGETFTAMLVGVGLMAVALRRSRGVWPAIALGVANTPASVLGLGLATVKHVFDSRRLRYLLIVPAAAALVATDTLVRLGELFNSGYASTRASSPATVLPYADATGFQYPFFFGLISILFSFGKGLIFFVPALLLPVRRRLREIKPELWNGYLLWLLFLAGLVLVYSKWWAWYGGGYFGPRFFLFASIPASFALATWLHRPPTNALARLVALALLALASWIAIDGAVFEQPGLVTCFQGNLQLEFLCWYTPHFSVLWQPFIHAERFEPFDFLWTGFCVTVFLRLAIPLIPGLVRSLGEAWRAQKPKYLRAEGWKF